MTAPFARPPQVPPYDKKEYQTIYPQYLDGTLTPDEGRRLTKCQSVGSPTLEEILHALHEIGFQDSFIDPSLSLPCAQAQARCIPPPRGCIKLVAKLHHVKLSEFDEKTSDPVVEQFPTKKSILREVARRILERNPNRPAPVGPPATKGTAVQSRTQKAKRR